MIQRAHSVKTGDISSALALDHGDVASEVAKIVVVGGATRMPFILEQIRVTWDVDLVDESLIDPVTAVASGAALAAIRGSGMSQVVERLPFNIELQSNNSSSKVLYTAYSPTVDHQTLRTQPKLSPYNKVFSIAEDDADLRICLVDPEEGVFKKIDLATLFARLNGGTFMLSIDEFGTILVKDQERSYRAAVEISNPVRHDLQVEAQRHFDERQEQLAVEERERLARQLGRNPHLYG